MTRRALIVARRETAVVALINLVALFVVVAFDWSTVGMVVLGVNGFLWLLLSNQAHLELRDQPTPIQDLEINKNLGGTP
jgi:hypothetical protein